MRLINPILKTLITVTSAILLITSPSHAQNIRTQSGIVAATSGFVRVVSEDIGRVAETGEKIFLNDIVETGKGGKMQIMLMDRTTVTIGPDTSLVIDEFVYDPGVERTLSATVLKGTFKLASPTLFNKGNEQREIKLPNAVVAIRGTELIGSVSATIQNVVLLNGAITVANDGFAQDIDRPNFGVSISDTGEISPPSFFSSDDLGVLLNQLEGDDTSDADESADTAASEEESTEEQSATESDGAEDEASSAESDTVASSSEAGEAAAPAALTAPSEDADAPAFITGIEDGPEPTEAEVVAAAEAIADGSADINDLQVLSRAGPQNIEAVANVLGVQFDEETGDITPESEAILAPTINAIISGEGLIRGDITADNLEAPSLAFNFEPSEGAPIFEIERPEGLDAPAFNFSFDRDNSFARDNGFEPTPFAASPLIIEGIDGEGFTPTIAEDAFFAPVIEYDPAAFESLVEFTVFEAERDFFFEPEGFYLGPSNISLGFDDEAAETERSESYESRLDSLEQTADSFDEEPSINIDNLVTEALEEVINEISTDTSSILPPGTYMPETSSYRSWDGSEWSTIAQNFDSGVVRFEHNNAEASFYSGSSCQNCSATVSNVVTIDFSAMEYFFNGAGVFQKPGYNPVEFTEATPNIPLSYWELSSGSILRLPNERELESTYDNPTVYTLTSSTDPADTVDATIDLDFLYDTQLSDNSDLNSNMGVYGYSEVEYTETGGSEVTFRTPEEAMRPIVD